MEEERRQQTLNNILIELGKLHQIALQNQNNIATLVERVGTQNGRIGKLEKWQAFLYGIAAVLTLFVIPLAIRFLGTWFDKLVT